MDMCNKIICWSVPIQRNKHREIFYNDDKVAYTYIGGEYKDKTDISVFINHDTDGTSPDELYATIHIYEYTCPNKITRQSIIKYPLGYTSIYVFNSIEEVLEKASMLLNK
jgi:hypothetical protein